MALIALILEFAIIVQIDNLVKISHYHPEEVMIPEVQVVEILHQSGFPG